MQQVSVTSVLLSQDTDLSGKDTSAQTSSDKGMAFSSYVEKHIDKEANKLTPKKTAAQTNLSASISKAANNEHSKTESGNNDHTQALTNKKNETRDTSDSLTEKEALINQNDENSTTEQASTGDTVEQVSPENSVELIKEDEEASDNSQILTESEQFISLLYNADNTLQKSVQDDFETLAQQSKATNPISIEGEDILQVKQGESKEQSGDSKKHSLKEFVDGIKDLSSSAKITRQTTEEQQLSEEKLSQVNKDNMAANNQAADDINLQKKLEQTPLNPILKDSVLHQKQAEAVTDYLSKESITDKGTINKNVATLLQPDVKVNSETKGEQVNNSSAKIADERLALTPQQLASLENVEESEYSGSAKSPEEITLVKAQGVNLSSTSTPAGAVNGNTLAKVTDERLVFTPQQLASIENVEEGEYSGSAKSPEEITLVKAQGVNLSSTSTLAGAVNGNSLAKVTDDQRQLPANLDNLSPHDDNELNQLPANDSVKVTPAFKDNQAQSALLSQNNLSKSVNKQTVQPTIVDEINDTSKRDVSVEETLNQIGNEELTLEKIAQPFDGSAKNTVNKSEVTPVTLFSFNRNTMAATTTTQDNYNNFVAQQASEVLNHNVVSDSAHIQKSSVQLHQETISIFRKDFADAVKDKVMVVISQKLQQFDISLDPPEFGNMQVRVNLQGEQAAVNFIVQNQQAKDALEQNMHKLKDMLAEQGVDVGGANVEQQNQQENESAQGDNSQHDQTGLSAANAEDAVEHILSSKVIESSSMSVDYYA
ncbi:flagellar hook-length control protein FliK [Colwellia sp. RSH04]|uniref:flagellar hook-length control protein FliK n=1 Tax=Colwellia sp. RSH04 TaxID=2305464 RepID=UPI000E597FAA|nr:flagellar hook-length control protein FliK [Colwellia sp. RSH04]RHW75986.1 flagellar hook-length control protein FliK [Colwellia sp. RSH04]